MFYISSEAMFYYLATVLGLMGLVVSAAIYRLKQLSGDVDQLTSMIHALTDTVPVPLQAVRDNGKARPVHCAALSSLWPQRHGD